jgi:hypothetical protein
MDVLKKIPHRHFVFSIPKILRRDFLYDRKLLANLNRCAWESLKVFVQDAVPENDPIPGAGIAIQQLWRLPRISSPLSHPGDIDPRTARQPRTSRPWNGWRRCVRISRTGASRWCGTADITAESREKNASHEGLDDAIPCILEPQGHEKAFRKRWARLLEKIDEYIQS